jgi:hypothetical protein
MKILLLIFVALMLAGCVAFPVYDDGYSYPDYGPYPYGYAGPNVSLFVSSFHGGGHGFHGGGHGFHGGGHWGGGRR